jgi:hypothetical protein
MQFVLSYFPNVNYDDDVKVDEMYLPEGVSTRGIEGKCLKNFGL